MPENPKNILVIGQGAAGLSAALAAAEAARAENLAAAITLIDKAPEADAGGNTRWSPSYMRMAAIDRVEPSFVQDMLAATGCKGDEGYFATLAAARARDGAWIASHGVRIHQPPYYLAKGPPRIQPVGGGEAIHRIDARRARRRRRHSVSAAGAEALIVDGGRDCRRASRRPARRCRPTRSCSPAAASRPTAR